MRSFSRGTVKYLTGALLYALTLSAEQVPSGPVDKPGAAAVTPGPAASPAATLALVGGTIVDVSAGGNSTADLHDAVVVVRGDEIVAVGPRRTTEIPKDARVVHIDGAYVVPGLNDVFAGLNSQAQANAYLYKGVTSIVGLDEPGGRRGALLESPRPSPRIRRMGYIDGMQETATGPVPLPMAATVHQVEEEAGRGAQVLVLDFQLDPEQVRLVVKRAHELGLPTNAVLGRTTYAQGIEAGIDSFVHTSRYSLELASPEMRDAVAGDPFGPPRTAFYTFLTGLDPDAAVVKRWAKLLAASRVALVPTLAIYYYDLPEHDNPWKDPIAAILDPNGIHLPVDRDTGRREAPPTGVPARFSPSIYRIEECYHRSGARYLAGSGTSAFGTLPGIALHLELRLLTRIGLTPRQALAAATGNVGEVYRWPKVGKVAAGYDADLVVVDADPTVDVRNLEKIRMVVLRGEIIDRKALLTPPKTAADPHGVSVR